MGRVLVTGGAKGMGAAIVRALVASGHDVTFTARSSGEAAEALAAELKAAHPDRDVAIATLDLADKAAVDAFCAELEKGEPFYGLVHNAGQPYDQLAAVMDQAKAEAVMQINFFAFTRLVNAMVRPMMRARTGRIVAIGSVTAERSNQGNAAYGASKAALAAYCRTLAIESAKRGVSVNVVAPGFVDTDMMAKYADYREKMESQIPAGRFARPEEIGGLVAYLMSPLAGYLTGATITLDGGLTASMGLQR
ncbi:MAG: short-chain dehydrogenase/reductase SDR [Xanthobacteraceae bacterium]|nr:MAG: short-chain dehydrogenase/reductase SDR [Xanthobacteraceae bacterium]